MRRLDEVVCVGDDIELTVTYIRSRKVTIKIKSKKDYGIIKSKGDLEIVMRLDQSITIGEIEIMVIKLQGFQVHFGFEAPKEIKIMRKELLD